MREQAAEAVDVIITEIGGTVGDIESLPFLEAARQVRHELGRDNAPSGRLAGAGIVASGELNTKPTQHSVAAPCTIGIQPDAIVLRADREVPEAIKSKIALMCDVDIEGVMTPPTPRDLRHPARDPRRGPGRLRGAAPRSAVPRRGLAWLEPPPASGPRARSPGRGRPGRQAHRPARRAPVRDAGAARRRFRHDAKVAIRWVAADDCQTPEGAQASLEGVDALLVPGGFGVRGIDGKVGALRWARENLVPTLGICLGLQSMVIEYARNVLGWAAPRRPSSTRPAATPSSRRWPSSRRSSTAAGDLGGTMRLGAYDAARPPAPSWPGVRQREVSERHRHRYEVNNAYRAELEEAGLLISGCRPLVPRRVRRAPGRVHPYFVSTQAHPEFKSRPTRAHPLFAGLIAAALEKSRPRLSMSGDVRSPTSSTRAGVRRLDVPFQGSRGRHGLGRGRPGRGRRHRPQGVRGPPLAPWSWWR